MSATQAAGNAARPSGIGAPMFILRREPQTPPRPSPRGRLGFVFHNRSGGSDSVDACHLLDGLDGEGQGAAAGGAAHDAGVTLKQIEERQQAPDHPILWNVPETDYLKFYLFQVI